MPFLEDVEALQAKASIKPARLPVVIGVISVCLAAVVVAVVFSFQQTISPDFHIESSVADASEPSSTESQGEPLPQIAVHVTGCVAKPGVYMLNSGARVQQAVGAAGGLTAEASDSGVNLARVVNDGEQIIIPSVVNETPEASAAVDSQPSSSGQGTDSLVNINTATAEQLQALPGIGESTAAKIISSREKEGPFATPQDLQRVSGIGEKKYAALADCICI